jgi:hypothetical protein
MFWGHLISWTVITADDFLQQISSQNIFGQNIVNSRQTFRSIPMTAAIKAIASNDECCLLILSVWR